MSLERLVDIESFSEREAVRPLPLFLLYLLTCFAPLMKTLPIITSLSASPPHSQRRRRQGLTIHTITAVLPFHFLRLDALFKFSLVFSVLLLAGSALL